MKKHNEKKLSLGKIRIATLTTARQQNGKDASFRLCNTFVGGNTCGDCLPTLVNCN